jgi:DNA polymerase I
MASQPAPLPDSQPQLAREWLFGWDHSIAGIVALWAERDGRVWIWQRDLAADRVLCQIKRFRPWLLLASLDFLAHLGSDLQPESAPDALRARATYRELHGPGALRFLVSAASGQWLESEICRGATRALGREVRRLSDLDDAQIYAAAPEEQFLMATGQTYYHSLAFGDLVRMQIDLETTGLDPARDAIFLIAARSNRGLSTTLDVRESGLSGPEAEADLIRRLIALVQDCDPDIIENHNWLGFDLPFLAARAQLLQVPLTLGRQGMAVRQRSAGRAYGAWRAAGDEGQAEEDGDARRTRYTIPGRESFDSLDAIRRYDFVNRELPSYGLKAVARHFGIAPADRTYLEGSAVYATWLRDPERVKRYALDDVAEAGALADLLSGSTFALAGMAPRRYERLADAGPATGILDPLLVRAYLHSGEALPLYSKSDGTVHTGAALYLFAAGRAARVFKADVSSLYPSLIRTYRITSKHDHLGVLLALVDQLVELRLEAKQRARTLPPGSPERFADEATSAAMKILVNSAYGYLGAPGLTRFADVSAANRVTQHGREVLRLICRELSARGAVLLEADTDGVYASAPPDWTEADERRAVAEVDACLPDLLHLEYEGRWSAGLFHEAKNYALLGYDGALTLRGVAFRSSRYEPFGDAFLRRAIRCLLLGDVPGVRAAYVEAALALQQRATPTEQVAARVRLTKTSAQYLGRQHARREAPYEAMLAGGRTRWSRGERVAIYRESGGRAVVWNPEQDRRDYDVPFYRRLLRETYAQRLARAFTAEDFAAVFAEPEQPSLFAPRLEEIRPIQAIVMDPSAIPIEPD